MEKQYYELTNPQKNIWMVELVNDGNNINNISGLFYIKNDEFKYDIHNEVLNELIKNNEALRLNIIKKNEEAFQYIKEFKKQNIEVIDMTSVTKREFNNYIKNEMLKPINILGEKLYEFKIIKLPNMKTCIFYKFHHIISDAWGLIQVATQYSKIYENLYNNIEKDIEIPSYTEYIESEKQYMKSDKYNKDEEFWNEYLKDINEPVTLKNVTKKITNSSKRYSVKLDKLLNEKINIYCKENKVSPYTLFMTALSTYIYRIKDVNDFIIGTPVLNRSNFKEKQMLGMFVSTIPMRFKIEENIKFKDLLKNVSCDTMSIFRHQKYPYNEIIKEVHSKTDVKKNLYNIVLSYQNARANYSDNKKYNAIWKEPNFIQDDLDIHIVDINNEGKLEIYYDYLIDLFDKIEIKYLHTRLIAIIEDAISNENVTVEDIRIMSVEEENKILYEFNDTDMDYPKDKTVIQLFEEQVEKNPDNIALVFEDKKMTYRELNEKANQLAHYLKEEKGVKELEFIGILVDKSVELIVSILAVLKNGCCYVPLEKIHLYERKKYILKNSNARLLITDEDIEMDIEKVNILDVIKIDFKEKTSLILKTSADSPNCVLYTSGTTGEPKGAVIVDRNIIKLVRDADYIEFTTNDKVLQAASTSFDVSLFEIWGALLNGASLYLIKKENLINPEYLSNYLRKNNITILWITSALFNQMIEYKAKMFVNLRRLFTGGDVISIPHVKILIKECEKLNVTNCYGPTECTSFTNTFNIIESPKNKIPIGKTISNTKGYVMDSKMRLLPLMIEGEYILAGESVALEYINNRELTKEKFISNLFENKFSCQRMYKTGDIVQMLFDGNVDFVGRRDNQVKINGLRIELDEIRNSIMKFKGIKDAVVIIDNIKTGKGIFAYFIANRKIEISNLKKYLKGKLLSYMVPIGIMQLDKLPINGNGKVDRKALPKIKNIINNKEIKSETELEIIKILKTNFGIEANLNTNIFEVGMDSLNVIKLCNNINEKYNVEIEFSFIFENPTVKEIANKIDKIDKNSNLLYKNTVTENITGAQKSIFMQYMLDTETTLYNIPFEISFQKEKLNLEKLLIAIKKTVLNHPILFSKFSIASGNIKQIIPKNFEYNIKSKKVTDKEYAKVKTNFVKSFDLLQSPLFKIEVYETSKNINILFDFHHIIFDGNSILIFIKDIENYYTGNLVEHEKQLFSDYVLNKKTKIKDVEYFKKLFEDELPINDMPYDRPRTKNVEYNGNKIYEKLDMETTKEIKNFILDNKVTLNSFMQSVFSIVLSKYMYSEDIIYGIANSGRNEEKIQNMIGMFVKNMPYRTKIDWNKSIFEYMNDTQKNIAEILSHDSLAYEEILKEINYTRISDRNPLIDIMFVCQNIYDNKLKIGNEKIKINELRTKNSKFDITFEIIPYENDIDITVEYRTSIFDESTIIGLINNYINIIKFIIKNNNGLLKDIDMISQEEKNKIINVFNNTKTKYPKFMSIHQMFEKTVKNYPDKIAVVFEKEKITYNELNKKANKLARLLIQKGLQKGDVVGVLVDKSSEYMIAILGVLKAGCVYMPISEEMPEERIKYVIDDSSTKIIITTKYFDKISDLRDKIYIDIKDEYSDYYFIENDTNLNLDTVSTDKAYIMYTSGTTGVPKGITIIHRGITRLLLNTNLVDYKSNDVMLVSGSITFDTSGFEIWGAMFYGMTLHFVQKKNILNPKYYETYILENGITTTLIPTPIFNQLTEYNASMFKNLRTLYTGGDVLLNNYSNEILKKCPDTKLINIYGPTENSVISSAEVVDYITKNNISIGKVISNSTCYVVDKCDKLCPIKVPGELYTGGDGLGLGYINKPEVTKEKFVKYKVLNENIYKTGDLVSYDENGKIKFFGRIDTQIKIRGQRIEILEIQNKILEINEINECVIMLKEQKNNKFLVAYYTSKNKIKEKEIINYLNKFLPKYMIPLKFIRIKEMPLNQNGKVDRKALPEIDFMKNSVKTPKNKFQKKILGIYKEVLKTDEIGMDDNFFDVGGDSLLVIALIGKFEENDIHINYSDLFKYTTPLELCNKLNEIELKEDVGIQEEIENYDYSKINNFIKRDKKIDFKFNKEIKNVFLTGATGFLGIHILDELLATNEKIIVYCLVRDKNGITAKERLYNKIQYYFGDKYDKLFGERIIVVNGDIITDKIIYEDKEKEIIDNFEIVINSLAHVKHFGEKQIFEEININGTKNISEFCIKNNKKLLHISTLSVSGNLLEGGQINQENIMPNTIYDEKSLFINQNLENLYAFSKFIAERIILENLEKGKIDAKIIRVGNLTGSYKDGKFQKNLNENAFLNRIKTFKNLKYIPENILGLDVEFSPVDLTAKAICNIAKSENNMNIYHVYNPNHIKLKEILKYFNEDFFDIKIISKEKMTEFIKEYKKNSLKNEVISGIIQDINSNNELEYQSNIKISCEKTVELLKCINFIWPKIDIEYLMKFFNAVGLLSENKGGM